MIMTNLIMAVRGVEAGVAFSAKRDNSKEIGLTFDRLLAKRKLARIRDFAPSSTVLSSDGTLEREIHRLLEDKEKENENSFSDWSDRFLG